MTTTDRLLESLIEVLKPIAAGFSFWLDEKAKEQADRALRDENFDTPADRIRKREERESWESAMRQRATVVTTIFEELVTATHPDGQEEHQCIEAVASLLVPAPSSYRHSHEIPWNRETALKIAREDIENGKWKASKISKFLRPAFDRILARCKDCPVSVSVPVASSKTRRRVSA